MSYLDSVNSPQDVKKLTTEELEALAGEMAVFRTRQPLISDRAGCEILQERPRRTEEKVAADLKAGYDGAAAQKSAALKNRLMNLR